MSEPESFLHDANTGRSLLTVAHKDPSAPAAREGAASVPKLFAEAL